MYIKRIMATGISKYERMVRNSKLDPTERECRHLHQSSRRCKTRLKKKALARENWFREKVKSKSSDEQNTHG